MQDLAKPKVREPLHFLDCRYEGACRAVDKYFVTCLLGFGRDNLKPKADKPQTNPKLQILSRKPEFVNPTF